MITHPRNFPFKTLLLFSILLILTCGCASNSLPPSNYQPDPEDVDIEAWSENFPFIYEDWESSVHGAAFLSGDDNAPTCNDCHADPLAGEIKTAEFRLEIPSRCARCHDDSDLMADYEIADDVVETYLADFHGTTIQYYAETAPTAMRDEAVCSDCHGSHAVYPADNPVSSVHPDNLPSTCQNCHPGAEASFASAYGHYRPVKSPASSKSDSTVVFIVKLAYQALIPLVLGGMLAYIGLDIFFRIKRKGATKKAAANETESDESEAQS